MSRLATPAQSLRLVYTFTNGWGGWDGSSVSPGFLLSGDTLYGSTEAGGAGGSGTMFCVNTDGSGFKVLHAITNGADGLGPSAFLRVGNTFFATSMQGGSNFQGTVFQLTLGTDAFVPLHVFNGWDGATPMAGLVLASNRLYGTTTFGGTNNSGVIFGIGTNGLDYSVIYAFTPFGYSPHTNLDGCWPPAALVSSGNMLYGVTSGGGTNAAGTVFCLHTDGSGFTTLHTFTNGADGTSPGARLLLCGDTLYGTASSGGSNGGGTVFSIKTNGSDFTVLHSFAPTSDGARPSSGLFLVGDTLFGAAYQNGLYGVGTVFMLRTNGSGFTPLHHFNNSAEGGHPMCDIAYSHGTLYGTLSVSDINYGVVFALMMQPTIQRLEKSDHDVTVHAGSGLAGQTYVMLMSTNVLLPLSAWATVATNIPVVSGDFTVTATNVVGVGGRYFTLRVE